MNIIQISAKAQHGKDSTAEFLKLALEEKGYKVLITHYADLVKYIATMFFGWDGKKDKKGRSLLQKIGTEDFRTVYPTFWIDFIKSVLTVYPNEWEYVLIPDCRFINESEAFNNNPNWKNIVIRVFRIGFESTLTPEQKQHPSETSLDDYVFDYYINSKSSLDYLKLEVEKFVKEMTNEK